MSESREAAGEPCEAADEPREAAGEPREAAGESRVLFPPSAAKKLRAFRASVVQFCGSGGKGGSGSR
eukprot:2944180-Pleurochrysis_carterae.AAC.1